MAVSSMSEMLIWLFIFSGQPTDLVSSLDPQMALECLGEKTDAESLLKILRGAAAAPAAADEKEAKTAIQNLASRSQAVRESAREKLAAMGEAIRARLEELVAKDPKRAEEAKLVLAKLDAAKASAASRRDVARILAMRLAAERKLADLAPEIEKLAASEDRLLQAASKAAVAAIKGEPAPQAEERPWASSLKSIEALPPATRFLLRVSPSEEKASKQPQPKPTEQLRTMFESFLSGEELHRAMREGTQFLVDFAVKYGNFRVDALACANVGALGPTESGLALLLSGEYQPAVLERGLSAEGSGWSVEKAGDWKVFGSGGNRIVLLDEHNVLFLPERMSGAFPLEEYLANFKEGKKALADHKRWKTFLQTLSGEASARGLAITDETLMREIYEGIESEEGDAIVSAVKGMQELEIDVRPGTGEKTAFRLEALFEKPEHAETLAAQVKEGIEGAIQQMEAMVSQLEGLSEEGEEQPAFAKIAKASMEFLKSIRVVADGKRGVLRGEIDEQAILGAFTGMGPGF